MNKKHELIINKLSEFNQLTANELAKYLNLSVRTIKTYIKEINEEFPGTIESSQKGYQIKTNIAKSELKRLIPSNETNQRKNTIIIKILNSKDSIDIFDLAEEMFISYSTLQNELRKIRNYLRLFDLELLTRNNLLTIVGEEKNKRKMISDLLYNESNIDFMNYTTIQDLFPNIDISYLKEQSLHTLEENQYFINDYSLVNFILHLTIMIDRMKQDNYTQLGNMLPPVPTEVYQICKNLAQKLEAKFHLNFTKTELLELSVLLLSRTTQFDYRTSDYLEIYKYIGEEVDELMNHIINHLSEQYFIILDKNSEFGMRFLLHIKNLTIRAKNNYLSRNPLTSSIKIQSPLIYDISVNIAAIIQEETHLTINDDEIAYIAFHLGSIIETQRQLTQTFTVLLYCPDYYQIARQLTSQITEKFGSRILIKDIINDEELILNYSEIDFIISTVPVNKQFNIPIQNISIFFNQNDQEKLNKLLEDLFKNRKQKEFESKLRTLLSPKLFEVSCKYNNKEEAIIYLSTKLYQNKYVSKNYLEHVLKRESLSSTAYNNFAIPHSMTMEAHKTGIAILINPDGIKWDNNIVQLVIMLCFSPNERLLFNEMFEPITNILMDPFSLNKIIDSQNYDELILNFITDSKFL